MAHTAGLGKAKSRLPVSALEAAGTVKVRGAGVVVHLLILWPRSKPTQQDINYQRCWIHALSLDNVSIPRIRISIQCGIHSL